MATVCDKYVTPPAYGLPPACPLSSDSSVSKKLCWLGQARLQVVLSVSFRWKRLTAVFWLVRYTPGAGVVVEVGNEVVVVGTGVVVVGTGVVVSGAGVVVEVGNEVVVVGTGVVVVGTGVVVTGQSDVSVPGKQMLGSSHWLLLAYAHESGRVVFTEKTAQSDVSVPTAHLFESLGSSHSLSLAF